MLLGVEDLSRQTAYPHLAKLRVSNASLKRRFSVLKCEITFIRLDVLLGCSYSGIRITTTHTTWNPCGLRLNARCTLSTVAAATFEFHGYPPPQNAWRYGRRTCPIFTASDYAVKRIFYLFAGEFGPQ